MVNTINNKSNRCIFRRKKNFLRYYNCAFVDVLVLFSHIQRYSVLINNTYSRFGAPGFQFDLIVNSFILTKHLRKIKQIIIVIFSLSEHQ